MFVAKVIGFIVVKFHRVRFETDKTSVKEIIILPYNLIDYLNVSLLELFSFNRL